MDKKYNIKIKNSSCIHILFIKEIMDNNFVNQHFWNKIMVFETFPLGIRIIFIYNRELDNSLNIIWENKSNIKDNIVLEYMEDNK